MKACPTAAPPSSTCSDDDIRVRDGSMSDMSASGTVEVCYTGLWGTVCGKITDWNDEAGTVVCRQLGYAELG